MAAVLRKLLPVVSSSPKRDRDSDGDEAGNSFSIDYSFAIEYHGPPIANVPRAVPVEVDQIPTALPVLSSSPLHDVSFPVIQPIVGTKIVSKRRSKESGFGSDQNGLGGLVAGSSVVLKGRHVVPRSSSSSSSSSSSTRVDIPGSASGDEGDKNSLYQRKSSGGLPSSSSSSLSSGRVDIVGSASVGESDHELPDETRSSVDLRASDELVHVAGLPGSFKRSQSLNNYDEGGGLRVDRDSADMGSRESGSDSSAPLPKDLSGEEEDVKTVNPGHVARAAVTFIEPPLSSANDEEFDPSDGESVLVTPKAERRGKRGTCYRCLTGTRFTEKEICIVCDAKYCFNCVLRAMGSMPEGRKCVTCIGKRIDESNRGRLGKCSRMLRRLLTDLEVKQIMSAEISCKTNQLPSRLIVVNGVPLSEEELFMLQTCPNPPKKLKPGEYWYDKVAGYWGKEGEKPCQIISPHMNIGGQIKRDASNGDTEIVINNREITKVELLMLQVVGVQCEGKPHFWVDSDGSYREEGQKHDKGNIWAKKRARIACAVLSLPIPPVPSEEEPNPYLPPYYEQKMLHKLLLIGSEKSGTSTIYKQARFVYDVPFSEDERQKIKLAIQTNLYIYLATLLEARERFEEEMLAEMSNNQSADQSGVATDDMIIHPCDTEQTGGKTVYSISPRLKSFSDWLLKEKEWGNLEVIFPASSRENARTVADLWKDPAIQATYIRIHETLPSHTTHFLERAIEISRPEYDPSETDILYAEGLASSVGLSCAEFSFPMHESSLGPDYDHDPNMRYQLIRLHPRSLGENCKWLEMFEDVDMVIFCVSLTDYDEYTEDGDGVLVNKMMANKQLFESIVTHPSLAEKKFLLFLTKFDLLEEKIERVPLRTCEWFEDFNPVISQNRNSRHNPPMAQRAFHYIAVQFKRLFDSLVSPPSWHGRSYRPKLFVSQVTLKSDTVDEALKYAREILKWHVEETSMVQEISTTSIEGSLSS